MRIPSVRFRRSRPAGMGGCSAGQSTSPNRGKVGPQLGASGAELEFKRLSKRERVARRAIPAEGHQVAVDSSELAAVRKIRGVHRPPETVQSYFLQEKRFSGGRHDRRKIAEGTKRRCI